jgi:hypothetical protein
MSTIKVKRGLKANVPTLSDGEFGLATDTKELFIGNSSGNIQMQTNNPIGFSPNFKATVLNGGSTTYDLRSPNNTVGRGIFLICCNAPFNSFCMGYYNGSSIVSLNVGADTTLQQSNANLASKLNVYQATMGVLGIQNNLGSDRVVCCYFFPSGY